MYLQRQVYDNGKPILYGLNSMRAPYGVSMSGDDVQLDKENRKAIPEGSFIVSVGNKVRFLPRAKVSTAVTTSSPNVTLKGGTSQYFMPNDVLYMVAGYAEVTFSGTIAATDTIGLRINGVTYTATAGGTTPAALVTAFITANSAALTAAGINASPKGATGTLVLIAKDAYPLNYTASSGSILISVNTTEPGYLGDQIMPLGTVLSVAPIASNGTRLLVLAANAAYNVPVDANVGVNVSAYLGIYPDPLDFTDTPVSHIAPIVEADGVYEQNLPYIDMQLKREMSNLRIDKRFYK